MTDAAAPRPWLRPLSPLYAAAIAARNAAYDRGWRRTLAVDVPVLSVGNLTTGGTGKTPIARALARDASQQGFRPAILLRGYRARGSSEPVPVWRDTLPEDALATWGDEALAHARALGGDAIVYAHPRRTDAAARAIVGGATLLILDDGFQHRSLHRDVDAVCLDWTVPLGRGGLLPAGDLREPPAALERADVLFWTRWREDEAGAPLRERLRSCARSAVAVRWRHLPGRLRRAGSTEAMSLRRVVAATGVANARSVAETVREAGLELLAHDARRDHAPFEDKGLRTLDERVRAEGADAILVTDKDEPRVLSTDRGVLLARAGRVAVLELRCEPMDDVAPVWKRLTARGRFAPER